MMMLMMMLMMLMDYNVDGWWCWWWMMINDDDDDDDLFCHSWSRKFGWGIQWRWTWRRWWVHGSETLVQTLSFGISLLSLCCLLCKFCYVPNDYLFSSQSIYTYIYSSVYLSLSTLSIYLSINAYLSGWVLSLLPQLGELQLIIARKINISLL